MPKRRTSGATARPGVVHVGLGLGQRDPPAADADLVDQRPLLALAQPAAVAVGQQVDRVEADVVARAGVLGARGCRGRRPGGRRACPGGGRRCVA